MRRWIPWLSLVLLPCGYAAESLCDALNMKDCRSVDKLTRRSSAKSLPSAGSATQFNPANVSHDRGLGIEAIHQAGNSLALNLVTGTGRTGAAVVSGKLENSFFGNRQIEASDDYLERRLTREQYRSKTYSGAAGVALIKNKNVSWDLGLSGRYHEDVKVVRPGVGSSLRVGIVSLGVATYRDDLVLAGPAGGPDYREAFEVHSFFSGVKLGNLFLDAGVIQSRYRLFEDDVFVRVYSGAYIWKKFLFNLALRHETSPVLKYRDGVLVPDANQRSTYAGVQYSVTRWGVVGVHYNYFLLDDMSLSLAIFF